MLGDALRKARLKADLTQEQLAFAAGISRNYISLLELNQKSPTVEVFVRICQSMGASPGRMLLQVEREFKK